MGKYERRQYPTRFTRAYAEVMGRIAADPSLPPFLPEERPINVTPFQWELIRQHILEGRVLRELSDQTGKDSSTLGNELEKAFHHLRQRWEGMLPARNPEQRKHRVEASLLIEGTIDSDQAQRIAARWHLLSQRLMVPTSDEPIEVTMTLRIG